MCYVKIDLAGTICKDCELVYPSNATFGTMWSKTCWCVVLLSYLSLNILQASLVYSSSLPIETYLVPLMEQELPTLPEHMTGSWLFWSSIRIKIHGLSGYLLLQFWSYSFNILYDVYTHNWGVHVHRILMVKRGHHLCLTDTLHFLSWVSIRPSICSLAFHI